MKFNELQHIQKPQPEPDTYEAGMAQNQLLKIGSHAVRLHNMLDDGQEMESWVAKKIDLASNYVKSVHGYTAGQKAGTYDDDGMSEEKECPPGQYYCKMSGKCKPIQEDASGFKLVSQAKDIAKKMAGNLTGAVKQIEKLQKDLSKNSSVQQALAQFNEDADAMDWSTDKVREFGDDLIKVSKGQVPDDLLNIDDLEDGWADADQASRDQKAETIGGQLISVLIGYLQFSAGQKPSAEDIKGAQEVANDPEFKKAYHSTESVSEDAGEGHMSKSQLYQTAKMAIELLDMIRKGDDLEGWVQTKLNLAADYLQAVYHYEDYQKLNPYREEIDGALMQKHAGVIQKNLDEILARETKTADVDTKPGMMRILKKRVNEVEKEIAKENRKETNEEATIKPYISMYKGKDGKQVYDVLDKNEKSAYKTSDERLAQYFFKKNYNKLRESGILYRAGVKKYGKAGMTAIQSAAAKGANHQEIGKIKDKHLKDDENLEEGIKEWGQRLAMAGVIVAGLAGVNSINNAIDNSVPAISAMNTALEMAQDSGNDKLAQMIEKDLSDAKIRLSSGKDLSHVADMQDKYAKFMKTEGMAYESKLAVNLKQRLK